MIVVILKRNKNKITKQTTRQQQAEKLYTLFIDIDSNKLFFIAWNDW